MGLVVVYDACVLYPAPVRDLLMEMAIFEYLQVHRLGARIHIVTRRQRAVGSRAASLERPLLFLQPRLRGLSDYFFATPELHRKNKKIVSICFS